MGVVLAIPIESENNYITTTELQYGWFPVNFPLE